MTKPKEIERGGGYELGHPFRGPGYKTPTADVGDGDNQGTPLWLFNLLREEWLFSGGDLFAAHGNALLGRYWTEDRPIITRDFENAGLTFWANPPYSRGNIRAAAETVRELTELGNRVVGLTRAEPTAEWWWRTLRPACAEVRLLDTRLTFRGQPNLYNFPCWVWVAVPPMQRRGEPHVWFWDASEIHDKFIGKERKQ